MAIGQISGVRALQKLKRLKLFIAAKLPRQWFGEHLSDNASLELEKVQNAMDVSAAKLLDSSIRHEHSEMFALQRDQQYARRSRRWLYTRALQTRWDNTYEEWAGFVRKNLDIPKLAKIEKEDPDQLATEPYKTLLT